MLKQIFQFLKRNPRYAMVCLGGIVSSLGTGFTQVAIYGELAKLGASPLHFTVVFAFSLLPGLISSRIGAFLADKYRATSLLAAAEILGAASTAMPLIGSLTKSIALLQYGQLIPAFLFGFSIPVIQKLTRAACEKEDLALASVFESYAFSLQVIFGIGVGTLLYGAVGAKLYFLFDIISYLVSAALIWFSYRQFNESRILPTAKILGVDDAKMNIKLKFSNMSATQKRAFLLLPALSIVGTPAMALLPIFGLKFPQTVSLGPLYLTPVVLCLFAKSLGQLLGPLLVPANAFEKYFNSNRIIWICSAGFIVLYALASLTSSLLLLLFLVITAHVLSNIIYIIASYAFKAHFLETQIAKISAQQFQLQIFLMAGLSLIAGQAANFYPPWVIIMTALPLAFLFFSIVGNDSKTTNIQQVTCEHS